MVLGLDIESVPFLLTRRKIIILCDIETVGRAGSFGFKANTYALVCKITWLPGAANQDDFLRGTTTTLDFEAPFLYSNKMSMNTY